MTDPRVQVTRYLVNCVPEDAVPDAHLWAVIVERHRDGTWSVGNGGGWCYAPPKAHVREPECRTGHRYSEDEALGVARWAAPRTCVNGVTVHRVLAREDFRKRLFPEKETPR